MSGAPPASAQSTRAQQVLKPLESYRAPLRSEPSPLARYALVNVEADRITNSLNTLKEQILRLPV